MSEPSTPDDAAPTDYLWTPATLHDAPALAAALNASTSADGTPERVSAEDMTHELDSSLQPLEQRTRVARTPDGGIAGFATVYLREATGNEHRAYVDTSVVPEARGGELEDALATWAVGAAAGALADSPSPRRFVCAWLYDSLTEAAARLKGLGFEPVRHWWEMERLLEAPIAEPATDGFRIEPWTDDHSVATRHISNSAFADHWGSSPRTAEEWRQQLIESPSFRQDLSHVATVDGLLVGYTFNQCWPEDSKAAGRNEAWIGSLGVLTEHRRRGIATALILRSMLTMRDTGFDAAMIAVDSASQTGAQRLYEAVGFRTKHRATTWQREIT